MCVCVCVCVEVWGEESIFLLALVFVSRWLVVIFRHARCVCVSCVAARISASFLRSLWIYARSVGSVTNMYGLFRHRGHSENKTESIWFNMAKVYHLRDVYSIRVVHYSTQPKCCSFYYFAFTRHKRRRQRTTGPLYGKTSCDWWYHHHHHIIITIRLCIGSQYRGACK